MAWKLYERKTLPTMMLSLLEFLLMSAIFQTNLKAFSLEGQEVPGLRQEGDILIGGVLPVHFTWPEMKNDFTKLPLLLPCKNFSMTTYGCVQAIKYAVDEINQDPSFLPNITLGLLIYDTCLSTKKAIECVLRMLNGQEIPVPNYHCEGRSPLAAVIGESSSTISISIARFLGLYKYPQVSYYSTSPLLNNKDQFPSFFRTIPSDDSQARGLAKLVVNFSWTWVGILSNEDDYGRLGSQTLKEELLKSGVCIAFHESLPIEPSSIKRILIVETIVRSSVHVIIAFCSSPYLVPLIRALSMHNVTGIIWIASEGWSTSSSFTSKDFASIMMDTIGLTVHEGAIPGFKDYLLKVHPSNHLKDNFVKPFWEQAMECHWPSSGSNSTLKSEQYIENTAVCTGEEKLEKFKAKYQNEPDPRIFVVIYNAVYAVAHALKNMVSCVPGHGPFNFKTCAKLLDFKPWQLLHYMKSLHITNKMRQEIFFDKHGSPPATYDIINWQQRPDGTIHYAKVGFFDTGGLRGPELFVNMSALQWIKEGRETPRSVCSDSCVPGYQRVVRAGQPICCFDCIPCSEGEISKKADSSYCYPCPSDQWPNEKRNNCVPKTVEFLAFTDPLAVALTSTVTLGSVVTMMVLFLFIKCQDTPIVKANNKNLTYLLLLALVMSFLCSLLFIGQPQQSTCLLRQPVFGIIFVLCVSCVLAKTIMVVIAFNATRPGRNRKRWLGPQMPVVTVTGCTLLQVFICATWLLLCPPFPENNMKQNTPTIIFQCNECSQAAFWCMMGYMGLLGFASFYVAFLARKLPDSFNEAKWITFSMLVFLSVWLSFIPSYMSTRGKYMAAVEAFGIISSSAGMLFCIFLPKCYFILMKPELNTRAHLLGKVATHNKKIKAI